MPIYMNIGATQILVDSLVESYEKPPTGQISFTPITVSFKYDPTFPSLMYDGAIGRALSQVLFDFYEPSTAGSEQLFMTLLLENVIVASFVVSAADKPYLTLGLEWEKMLVRTLNPSTGNELQRAVFTRTLT